MQWYRSCHENNHRYCRSCEKQDCIQAAMLEIRWRQGLIEIEPASLPVKLKQRGQFLIAMPDHPIEQLTSETVERARRQLICNRRASSHT